MSLRILPFSFFYSRFKMFVNNNNHKEQHTNPMKKYDCRFDSEESFVMNDKKGAFKEKSYLKWKVSENQKYAKFLLDHYLEFSSDQKRRSLFTFNKMSKQIQNKRNNTQCRSHHQKMMRKYGSAKAIIQAFLPEVSQLMQSLEERKNVVEKNENSLDEIDQPKEQLFRRSQLEVSLRQYEDEAPEFDETIFNVGKSDFHNFFS